MRKRGLCCRPVSVCLSVRHVGGLHPDGKRYCQTSFSAHWPHHSSFYSPQRRYSNPRRTPSEGTQNTRGGIFFAIFYGNHRLSRKRYEIDRYYRTLIKSHTLSIEWWHFQWSWRTPNPVFKVTVILKSIKCLKNGAS